MFKLTHDDISPALSRLAATARNPKPVLRAMGTTFMSITMGNFQKNATYRPKPWPNKTDGTPSNLQKSTTLAKSFHLEVTDTYAKLSNPTIYAPVHQFGATIRAKDGGRLRFSLGGKTIYAKSVTIPARPFFPVVDDRLTSAAEEKIANAGRRVIEKQAGGN